MHFEYNLYVARYRQENQTVQKTLHAAPYQCCVVFVTCALRPVQRAENRSQARRTGGREIKKKETRGNLYTSEGKVREK